MLQKAVCRITRVGRCAIESIACGCACILCDYEGIGPLITTENIPALQELNFGRIFLQQQVTRGAVVEQIACYNPHNAIQVQQFVHENLNLAKVVSRYEEIYYKVLEENLLLPRTGLAEGFPSSRRIAAG